MTLGHVLGGQQLLGFGVKGFQGWSFQQECSQAKAPTF